MDQYFDYEAQRPIPQTANIVSKMLEIKALIPKLFSSLSSDEEAQTGESSHSHIHELYEVKTES